MTVVKIKLEQLLGRATVREQTAPPPHAGR
jgi:hypothetical protein